MIKVKTAGQMLPFEKWHGFAQSISTTIFSLIAIVAAITAVIAAYIAHRSCLVLIDRALEATRLASLAMVRISSSRASRKRYSFSSNQAKQNSCEGLPKSYPSSP